MRKIDELYVHCSATPPNWRASESLESKIAEIARWHTERWPDNPGIAYHRVIDRDGRVLQGRPDASVGYHCRGRNSRSLSIVLLGGASSDANDPFEKNFTPEQSETLENEIARYRMKYPAIKRVKGHNEVKGVAKACPGFRLGKWMGGRGERKVLAQSSTMKAAGLNIAGATALGGVAVSVLDVLSPLAQGAVIGALILLGATAAWIARERIVRWLHGDR